ncbi:hypothetical protein [Brevundimonas vesicularis]|uniref:Uncharacterized protein n=1 Tax=Brevundimonas vesicularis TaxID=41276 RepID=A0A1Z3U769_BREVE|nr:hypothetical protein [Brevundimonas vesicularis]ASE39146.1 hypothetical protein CEP68_06315 [Brevundimonas vesicularis]
MAKTKTDAELAADAQAALDEAAAITREISGRQLIKVQAFADAVAAGDVEAARKAAEGLPEPAAGWARNWLTVNDGVPSLLAGEIDRLTVASSEPKPLPQPAPEPDAPTA